MSKNKTTETDAIETQAIETEATETQESQPETESPGDELARLSRELDEEAAKEEAERASKKKAPKSKREPAPCACGCGETTRGDWFPGHDGVLTGVCVRVTKGGSRTKGGPRPGDGEALIRFARNFQAIEAASPHHASLVARAVQALKSRQTAVKAA